jgi:hypothetical protein
VGVGPGGDGRYAEGKAVPDARPLL